MMNLTVLIGTVMINSMAHWFGHDNGCGCQRVDIGVSIVLLYNWLCSRRSTASVVNAPDTDSH